VSMLPAKAMIVGSGAITSVGYCVPQIWASVRAGIAKFSRSRLIDNNFEPFRIAEIDENDLEDLLPENATITMSDRERRMLRLAAPALREALDGRAGKPPVFLGLPRPTPSRASCQQTTYISALAAQAGVSLDEIRSRVFPNGRAAFFLAVDEALRYLAEGKGPDAVVGGVDSYLVPELLGRLFAENRLLSDRVSDGFIPGEGAGFVVLSRVSGTPKVKSCLIGGVGLASDLGHRYSKSPSLGEGLSSAISALEENSRGAELRFFTVFAGLNGEGFGAKEWGVARIRHSASFASEGRLEHPADCFGDIGAAAGGVLTALAHASLVGRHRQGPVLVWASSDHEERGCLTLELA
jgi:3-oxoacyl-[acyl-carrier-protein] synthase I